MTRTLLILTLALSALACAVTGPSTPPPATVDLSGAAALYVQAPAGAKSIIATDGATLMKLLTSGATGPATFEDALGAEVTVSITRTHQLTDEYLLADLDYGEATLTALVTLSTGELRAPPINPEAWEKIRVKGNIAYYITAGSLYRLDLDTFAAKIMNDGVGAQHAAGSTLIVINPNDCVFAFTTVDGNVWPNTNNKYFVYYQDGSTPVDITGSSGAMLFALLYAGDYGDRIVEDRSTQDIYLLTFGETQLVSQRMQFHDDGFIFVDPDQIITAWSGGAAKRLASETDYPYLDNSLWGHNKTLARLGAIGGQLTTEVFVASEGYFSGDRQEAIYRDGEIFYADANQYTPGIRRYQLGAVLTETQVVTDEIDSFEVVAGEVFYAMPSGTWKKDLDTGATELYSADPLEILAVTR